MNYFYINLFVGICLTAILLTVFFRAAGKSPKQRFADRELLLSLGDEGLLRLYDQAETENERDGIIEFVREKLIADGNDPNDYNLMPAGTLNPEEIAPPDIMSDTSRHIIPGMVAQNQGQPIPGTAQQSMAQIMPQISGQTAEQERSSLSANERRQITGMMAADSLGAADDAFSNTMATHELPMDKLDWAAIEEALEKKREEYARIMAHNQLIQDVFSKIQNVETRLIGNKPENNN